MKVRLRPTTAM